MPQRTFEAQIVNKCFRLLACLRLHVTTRKELAEATFDFGFGKQIVPFSLKTGRLDIKTTIDIVPTKA